jgi:DNA-binding Lrp family transcriptional regulator
MDKRKILSDKITISAKKRRLVIMLEQNFDVVEHEHGHSNSKIGQDVGMSESMAWNIIKHRRNKRKR